MPSIPCADRSPQSAVRSPQSAVRSPQSAVRSPQSAVRSILLFLAFCQANLCANHNVLSCKVYGAFYTYLNIVRLYSPIGIVFKTHINVVNIKHGYAKLFAVSLVFIHGRNMIKFRDEWFMFP